MEELRYQLYEEEMRECTFRPQITEVASRLGSSYPPAVLQSNDEESVSYSFDNESFHSGGGGGGGGGSGSGVGGLPAYERLYHQKNKIPKSIAEKRHRTREERELDGCTFTPQLFHTKTEHAKRSSTNLSPSRRSFEQRHLVGEDGDEAREGDREEDEEEEEDEVEGEGERREERLKRQSSIETFEILNERSTKNSIIELMRGGKREQPQQQPGPESPPPPPPPPHEPKGYAESVHRCVSTTLSVLSDDSIHVSLSLTSSE
jgi:hypothetical protein